MRRFVVMHQEQPPSSKDIDKDLKWMCKNLGFVSGRDTRETSIRLFQKIIKDLSKNKEVRTSELEKETNTDRGTINHHIRNYIASGFMIREKNKIRMRSSSVKKTLIEIHRDVDRVFEDLEYIAEEIDKELGFGNR